MFPFALQSTIAVQTGRLRFLSVAFLEWMNSTFTSSCLRGLLTNGTGFLPRPRHSSSNVQQATHSGHGTGRSGFSTVRAVYLPWIEHVIFENQ